jgi:hypothetical protein
MFIGYFDGPSGAVNDPIRTAHRFKTVRPIRPVPLQFEKFIQDTSPAFCTVYSEAYEAEQLGLTEICGVGYRKALEFLIKDYLIKNEAGNEAAIKSTHLGTCIETYVKDEKIKQVAKRATWLGNDETHYERRWKNKDLSDLKTMIGLVLHWTQAEHLTKEALKSMPPKGPTA